jgi:hypothetical protein
MKITSTNDGGILLVLSAEEVGAIIKASQQTQLFEEPTPIFENIYKRLRVHSVAFIDELRDKYDRTWIDTRSEQFQDLRYKHRVTEYGMLFKLLQERGGIISEMEGGKYARVRFLW